MTCGSERRKCVISTVRLPQLEPPPPPPPPTCAAKSSWTAANPARLCHCPSTSMHERLSRSCHCIIHCVAPAVGPLTLSFVSLHALPLTEATNARIANYSVVSLFICIGVGVWQLFYLKNFFVRKKIL